ncbi:MAG: VOC family protein [Acidimicrobiales bacterium]
MVKSQPDNYRTITATLAVDGAAGAIEFYRNVFGATERLRMSAPGDKVAHAELEIGDSVLMLADEFPEADFFGPSRFGGTPIALSVYVDDVDATFARALAAGAVAIRPPEDQFYGDRAGQFLDPWGYRWGVATHVEDVDPAELARRQAELFGDD